MLTLATSELTIAKHDVDWHRLEKSVGISPPRNGAKITYNFNQG